MQTLGRRSFTPNRMEKVQALPPSGHAEKLNIDRPSEHLSK